MKTHLVVTITCPDRTGIVERITEIVVAHAANWEDSRMARLGGDFAGIVMISVAEDQAESLQAALLALVNDETTVAVRRTQAAALQAHTGNALLGLHLTGADHEGIVHKVSAYLAGQGINVESMETTVSRAPMSAMPLFHMEAIVKIPSGLSVDELRRSLRHIGEDLGVDIDVDRSEK